MNTQSPIFNVLPVTSVYSTASKTVYEFLNTQAVGTMALFNKVSGVWVTVGTLAAATNDVFIGVIATDKAGNKILKKSVGEHFNKNNIISKIYTDYAAGVNSVVAIDLTSGASLYYVNGIRINFRNPDMDYELGYNLYTKYYPIQKVAGETSSTVYTQSDLYNRLLDSINLEPNSYVTPYLNVNFLAADTPTVVTTGGAAIGDITDGASPTPANLIDVSALGTGTCTLDSTSTKCYDSAGDLVYTFDATNDVVTFTKKYASKAMEQVDAAATDFDGMKLLLSINPADETIFGQMNLKYAQPRQTRVIVTVDQPGNEVTVVNNADPDYTANTYYLNGSGVAKFAYEKGSGYDLKNIEAQAMAWEGTKYPFGNFYYTENQYKYLIDESKNYHVCTLNYALTGEEGMFSYKDSAMTMLVVDTVTDSSGFSGSNTVANLIQDMLGS